MPSQTPNVTYISIVTYCQATCRTSIIILLSLLTTTHGFGQILNVEKERMKGDSANYFLGTVGLSFNANNQSLTNDGTEKSFVGLTANSDAAYFSTYHSFLLIGQLQYTATSETAINSAGYGHFRINWLRKNIISYENFVQIQYDQGRGMQSRRLAGGGVRFRIYREEKSSLFAGTGVMYEREEWEQPSGEGGSVALGLWKNSSYLTSRLQLRENIAFGSIAYFQTGYDPDQDFFRHRVSGDINILINVTSKLALQTAVGLAYENRPVVPIPKFVYRVTNGIQLNF
ncbi:DUF481 domain-containing protein [Tunicatimonas pelagia]|uniref:DUF481 domain-containing protein n=1 Tax=Tunicatimonas pelagia TaxID=931531 RepID=UPI0026662C6E|nr:DUF481 domain-containing protein [Tunicatimonas pelagia]WKN42100.1 DUF481 domain-containing protein [Tunicatimonas pelagia]